VPPAFHEIYGSAAGGRTVSAKRWLPTAPDDAATEVPWPLRAVDIDLLGHLNNAAYWAAIEDQLAPARPPAEPHPLLRGPHRAVIEYGAGIEPGAAVVLRVAVSREPRSAAGADGQFPRVDGDVRADPLGCGDRLAVWFTVDGVTHATVAVMPLPQTVSP
jgi:acyl-ACP thioesterase